GNPPQVLTTKDTAAEEFTVFKRTQVQLLKSNFVLQATLREKDIARLEMVRENSDDPVAWLQGQLIIDYPDDAEIMRVAIKGKKKDETTKLVDKVVDEYMKEVVERDK